MPAPQTHSLFTYQNNVYRETVLQLDEVQVRANGLPTRVSQGVYHGYSLPLYAANEELFFHVHIMHDWDEASDLIALIHVYLDTANNAKNFKLQASWENITTGNNITGTPNGDLVPATSNDVEVQVATGNASQYQTYEVPFTIDYDIDGGGNELVRGDCIGLRLRRIAALANEIAGEVVVYMNMIRYQVNNLGMPV